MSRLSRPLLLMGMALLVIAGGIIALVIASPSLATRTVRSADGKVFHFRIYQRDGRIYVSAGEQRGAFENGGGTIMLLGKADFLDTHPAAILLNDEEQIVTLQASRRVVRYDLKTKRMEAPETEP